VADWDARRAQALRASTTVRVLQWLQPAGAAVAAGSALAVLAPPDGEGPAWEAQLFAPSRALGHVSPGQTVRLRLAAWPAARWGHLSGRVHEVGAVPLGPAELPAHQAGALAAALQSPEPLYRVAVRLDQAEPRLRGQALALRAGLSLDADLLHERRPLWAWVLAPWQRWRQRLDSPDA
jgi:membrane fusion protein